MKQIGILFLCLMTWACNKPNHKNIIYPAPGDLSEIEGLSESPVFDAMINGQDAFVYRTLEIEPQKHSKKGVSYLCFEYDTNVKTNVVISTTEICERFQVLPDFKGSIEQINEHQVELKPTSHGKYVFIAQLSNLKEQYFILSIDPLEEDTPSPNDPTVLYLESGVHRYGQSWDPFVNGIKTLYLSGGAVLEATIKSKRKKDISKTKRHSSVF